jgi:hypothetical protein
MLNVRIGAAGGAGAWEHMAVYGSGSTTLPSTMFLFYDFFINIWTFVTFSPYILSNCPLLSPFLNPITPPCTNHDECSCFSNLALLVGPRGRGAKWRETDLESADKNQGNIPGPAGRQKAADISRTHLLMAESEVCSTPQKL